MHVPSGRTAALVIAVALFVVACSTDQNMSPTAATPPPTPEIAKVAVAYDLTGRGDGGFNDIAYAGALQAATQLDLEIQEVTARPDDTDDDRAERLRLLASSGFGAIICVGFTYAEPLKVVAAEFPDVAFAIVDDGTVEAPNVQGILFAEHEGSFLVGAAAALKSRTGRVGFIGAVQVPLIQKFEAGFVAGAKHVDADVEWDSTYLSQPPDFSGFGDPAHGKEAALGMYDSGVDVIFAAAGGSGSGVHEAATETNHWSIGVDADEFNLAPSGEVRNHILTSMLKNANVGTEAFVRAVAGGTFEGGVLTYGLAENGVGYARSGGFLADVTEQLDALAAAIVAGEITVPETP